MLGVMFFVLDEKIRYAHFIWHAFVLLGSVCHFVAVLAFDSARTSQRNCQA